jgi:hypothetical protein
MESRTGYTAELARNAELMDLRIKASLNKQLTRAEEIRLFYDTATLLTSWEWQFEQFKNGYLDSFPSSALARAVSNLHILRLWPQLKANYSLDFVAFMEEEVISQLE